MAAEIDGLLLLEAEVTNARASTISKNSRASYLGSTVRFLQWMFQNKRTLVTDCFANSLIYDDHGVADKTSIKSALSSAPANPPIDFDRITARDFLTWVFSMKKRNGDFHSFSTYAGHRSAFYNLFQDYHRVMSAGLEREMSSHFKGLQRQVAAAISQGHGQIKVGKDPMSFGLYKQVALAMLQSTSRDMIFARTFMILSWNLMSRAANTVSICYGHLAWSDDALCVYFAHMKNDQRGTRPRDPRHVYANPISPEICPILALGIYWAMYGFDTNDVHLFPGNDEYERFRKVLGRILKGAEVRPELERRGISPDDIGTHSMRKGASTYCSSGSTACHPAVAVHLRAGWSMGGVQDRYLRHDADGDMFVGRTVSGLPILQPEFAVLPPRFTTSDEEVQRAKSCCFPGLPQSVEFVAEFALASLIYHVDFLRKHLSDTHPLFQSPLFSDAELISQQRSRLQSDSNNDELQPTGVPPHVQILGELQAVRSDLKKTVELRRADMQQLTKAQNEMYERLISGVTTIMEERAIQTGVPTCDSMAASIMRRLEDEGVLQLLRPRDELATVCDTSLVADTNEGAVVETMPDQFPAYPIHNWGGAMHLFPEGVKLPTGTPEQAWMYWCCGNSAQNLPPFRVMLPIDLSTKNLRKRLSDLKFLMSKIEQAAQRLNLSITNLSASEAATVFQQCKSAIELPAETEKNRKRRRGQLVWSSVATILCQKKPRHSNDGNVRTH